MRPKTFKPRYLNDQDKAIVTIYVDAKKVASEVYKQMQQDTRQFQRLGRM